MLQTHPFVERLLLIIRLGCRKNTWMMEMLSFLISFQTMFYFWIQSHLAVFRLQHLWTQFLNYVGVAAEHAPTLTLATHLALMLLTHTHAITLTPKFLHLKMITTRSTTTPTPNQKGLLATEKQLESIGRRRRLTLHTWRRKLRNCVWWISN